MHIAHTNPNRFECQNMNQLKFFNGIIFTFEIIHLF
jgi:hypothetical protein